MHQQRAAREAQPAFFRLSVRRTILRRAAVHARAGMAFTARGKAPLLLALAAFLAAGCTTPLPSPPPTLLPVVVEVVASTAIAEPEPTASPAPSASRTPSLAPTETNAPAPAASATPVTGQAVGVSASPAPTKTQLPAASATPATSATPPIAQAAVVSAPPTPPLPAGVSVQDVADAEQHTLDLITAQRAAAGLPPMKRDETLMGIARARVADMVARHYTGHTDPVTGVGLGKAMMRAAGYTSGFMAENWYGYAQGPAAAADAAMAWFMTDPPHAANILSPNFVGVGVGLAYNGQLWLLVQDFAGK
jgi:uncharacterized protein YkwD